MYFASFAHPLSLIFENREWRVVPKQDHLVCFLGGSLMLGATTAGAVTQQVSKPPLPDELWDVGKRDWNTGSELLETCIDTHDTATCVNLLSLAGIEETLNVLFFSQGIAS